MPTPANSLNLTAAGLVRFDGVSVFSGVTTTTNSVLIGAASNGITSIAAGLTNQVLLGNTGLAPSFGAVPAGALPGSGQITLTDGTNITVTGSPLSLGGTATIAVSGPPSATTLTNHGVVIGQSTSAVVATAAGSAGQVLQSGGAAADPTYSTATYPSIATGTGKILRADGTNWVATTATYPNVATGTGTILRADGTNWVPSTATYPNTAGAVGNVLTSDGTNWISSSSSSTSITWVAITADQTAAINTNYLCNKAGLLTLTIPTTAAVGSVIGVMNINTALGVKILSANPGQLILGTVSASANTGHLDSINLGDSLFLVCVVANTTWRSYGVQGNWTIV